MGFWKKLAKVGSLAAKGAVPGIAPVADAVQQGIKDHQDEKQSKQETRRAIAGQIALAAIKNPIVLILILGLAVLVYLSGPADFASNVLKIFKSFTG